MTISDYIDPIQTVNFSMTSAIALLHPIAILNQEEALQTVYFEPKKGTAITGFRREVANFGACLVKAQYGEDNTLILGNDYIHRRGHYNFNYKGEFHESNLGLPGMMLPSGDREAVNSELASVYINKVKDKVFDKYEVGLNPGQVHEFMNGLIEKHGVSIRDRKVNMQFTNGVPQGYLVAKAERQVDREMAVVLNIPTKNGVVKVTLYIHESSKIHVTDLEENVRYLVSPVEIDEKTGRRYAKVLRPYSDGIRMAVQSFKMGIIKPGDQGYDVNPDKGNGILARDILDMEYLNGQKKERIEGAPMVIVDFDMFSRMMHVFSGYEYVVMYFNSSTDGIYFYAPGDEYRPEMEAIMGGTIPHVRGRVWLP